MAEIIPRSKARPPWWLNALLAVSLIFLGAAIGGRIFFRISAEGLREQKEDALQQIVNLRTPANQELEKRLVNYQTQINAFNNLLSQRYLTSRVLNLMEETIHPEVLYEEFLVNIEEKRIQITASSQSYKAIGEQLLVLNNDSRIKRVDTSNYSRDKEGWINFRIMIEFDPEIIRQL